MSPAEQVAEYVLSHVRQRAPHTWRQAARSPSLQCSASSPNLEVFAAQRLRGVKELAVKGLFLIEAGFPVQVSRDVFSPEQVLALQARGQRCLSLLAAEQLVEPHSDGLAFVLHDLCHLAKFAHPTHFDEQVGFFASVQRAFDEPAWRGIERVLDDRWRADRAHVSADMNGSSIFLFAFLRAKLKMAALRGRHDFADLFETLLDVLDLSGAIRDAARSTSARTDDPNAAALLAEHFRQLGLASVHGHHRSNAHPSSTLPNTPPNPCCAGS